MHCIEMRSIEMKALAVFSYRGGDAAELFEAVHAPFDEVAVCRPRDRNPSLVKNSEFAESVG
jgi:hypothetical protein